MSDLRACAQRASCTGWEPCADEGHRNPPGAKVRRNASDSGSNLSFGDELTFGLGLTAPLYGDFRDPGKLRGHGGGGARHATAPP